MSVVVNYLSQSGSLTEEQAIKLPAVTGNVPIDKKLIEMEDWEIVYNMQVLTKVTEELKQIGDVSTLQSDNAAFKARILELEADLVKYQKLYFAISRPPPS